MARDTHYEVLGVAPTASTAEVQTAYRAAARRMHPDAGGTAIAMQRVNEAWHVLRDPGRRSAYDRTLAQDLPTRDVGVTGHVADAAEMVDADDVEAVEFADDLLDTVPVGSIHSLEGWLALLPPAALMLTIVFFAGALIFASPTLLVFSGGAGLVAVGLFVMAPLVAMTRSPRSPRAGRAGRSGRSDR